MPLSAGVSHKGLTMDRKRALDDAASHPSATKRHKALESCDFSSHNSTCFTDCSHSNYASPDVGVVTSLSHPRISRTASAHNGATKPSDIASNSTAIASSNKADRTCLVCEGCGSDGLLTIEEVRRHDEYLRAALQNCWENALKSWYRNAPSPADLMAGFNGYSCRSYYPPTNPIEPLSGQFTQPPSAPPDASTYSTSDVRFLAPLPSHQFNSLYDFDISYSSTIEDPEMNIPHLTTTVPGDRGMHLSTQP